LSHKIPLKIFLTNIKLWVYVVRDKCGILGMNYFFLLLIFVGGLYVDDVLSGQ